MNSKIKCLILDDELPGLTYLRMLCEQLPFVEVEKCFSQPELFLKEYKKLSFDVCLLDINMPGVNGIEIAQLLKDKQVIFTSAHPEYAINAFELEAVDFIKKPVTRERLEKALLKAKNTREKKEPEKNYFTWNTDKGKSTLYFSEILYITTSSTDKRDKPVLLAGGAELLLKNIKIKTLLEILPAKEFIRINKSDIVARKAVQSFTSDAIVLKNKPTERTQFTVSLGDAYRKSFMDWI